MSTSEQKRKTRLAVQNGTYVPTGKRKLSPCGTHGAYARGCRCGPCRAVRLAYLAKYRATARGKAITDTARAKFAATSPEVNALSKLKYRLRKYYNISVEQYDALIAAQGNACAMCRYSFEGGPTPHVDHCHETKRVRGILCNGCNCGLGKMGDSVEGLERAIAYLRNSVGGPSIAKYKTRAKHQGLPSIEEHW